MNELKQALQQALDVLESIASEFGPCGITESIRPAIAAAEAALAKPGPEPERRIVAFGRISQTAGGEPLYAISAPTQSAELAAVTTERNRLRAEAERLQSALDDARAGESVAQLAAEQTCSRALRPLSDLLAEHEAAFVRLVHAMPGSKLNGYGQASRWVDDGTEYGATVQHWRRPEELGLIKCVGSYKWAPTDRLVLAAQDAQDGERAHGINAAATTPSAPRAPADPR